MNEKFILVFRVNYKLVYLISFEFFLSDLEEIVYIEVPLSDIYVPHTDATSRITYEETAISIVDKAIWMDVVKACLTH